MIEAVGREFLTEYWAIVERCMKTDNSVGVVQVITIPEPRRYTYCLSRRGLIRDVSGYDRYIREIDFIRKWVSEAGYGCRWYI
jgi:cyclopropane-fatty-acyl-phospholipid synthase